MSVGRETERSHQLLQIANYLIKIAGDSEDQNALEPAAEGGTIDYHMGKRLSPLADPRARVRQSRYRAIAANLYKRRAARFRYFESELFSDPAWDMLLDLYVHEAGGLSVGTSSLCIASNVPSTTALRWISHLCQLGLIEKHKHLSDKRVTLISLTASARRAMEDYLFDEFISESPESRFMLKDRASQ